MSQLLVFVLEICIVLYQSKGKYCNKTKYNRPPIYDLEQYKTLVNNCVAVTSFFVAAKLHRIAY